MLYIVLFNFKSPRNSTGYHFFKVDPKKSLNFKFCFDNSFSLVSEKKIRFEIFPDIDMDEWQDQLEEFRQEHQGFLRNFL